MRHRLTQTNKFFMSLLRFTAIDLVQNRMIPQVVAPTAKISQFYGTNVFGDDAMREYMTPNTFKALKESINRGTKLSKDTATDVASAMQKWAEDKGVTHYSHWFQPLTGRTAEKHDSFFTLDLGSGKAIEEFKYDALVQQEPDGSSFPGGGLRSTFEARGYTAWDPSSPAFILEVEGGKTLCIPTIFTTYSGDALDFKLPLLRSQTYLEEHAIKVCKMFDENVTKVSVTLGWEQEYFLVDEALYNARPDLSVAGRALLGASSAKGQQLDDHYFGSIPERVYAFMRDLETECHKLGIPVRTRHNEVAPGQYELAPMFEEVNVAVDHNTLLMDIMDRVARRHSLRCLLHEKPFSFINGSGKHNNWSLSTDTGINLLSPGKEPSKNLLFLTFFINTIKAVFEHNELLRASVASANNDHRLGANEAPPAIISVFCGETLDKILNVIERGKGIHFDDLSVEMDLLAKIPTLEAHTSDRNRTSPFAFTGNKFEFRMVGSAMNCAGPMTVLNTIMGKQLAEFHDDVEKLLATEKDREEAILNVLRRYIRQSKAIRFEGDGYSNEWKDEAAKRGLPNEPISCKAYDAYVSKKGRKLFTESNVLTERELSAHYSVKIERYIKDLQIEAYLLSDMFLSHILPVVVEYNNLLMDSVIKSKELGLAEVMYQTQLDLVQQIGAHLGKAKTFHDQMMHNLHAAEKITDERAEAVAMAETVKPFFEQIRNHVDELELLVDNKRWPFPKMSELLFMR